jgi:hypothetical protein
MKSADLCPISGKSDGRGTYCFFEAGMDARAQARQLLEIDLRATLKRADRILLPADPCSHCSARATRGAP